MGAQAAMGRRSLSLSFSSFSSLLALPSYFSYNCHSDWPAVTGRGPGCFPAADYHGGEKTARNGLKRVFTPPPLPVGGGGKGWGVETTDISNILAFLWREQTNSNNSNNNNR